MALSTYDDLKAVVADYLDRTDLTDQIPDFITMAEASFNRVIRQPDMITKNDSFSIAGRYTTLPTDTLEIVRIVLDLTPVVVLEYMTPEELSERRVSLTGGGKPYYFTTIGGSASQLEVLRSPDQTYTASIIYYTRIAALTDSATTNWLLTNHPDIYLYGALVEAEPYLKNDDRMPMWTSRLDKALNDLRLQGQRERHTASGLRMRSVALG